MSLSVAPRAVEPTKRSVPAMETTATVPSGECLVPSTPGVGKTRKYCLSPSKIDQYIVAIVTIRSELADHASLLLKTYMGHEYLACVSLEQGLHNLSKGPT